MSAEDALAIYLAPNPFVDSDHPAVVAYAERHRAAGGEVATAVALYHAIRDGFRYSPWGVSLEPEAFRASAVAQRTYEEGGHCIDKALLLAAAARAVPMWFRTFAKCRRLGIPTARAAAARRSALSMQWPPTS